MPPSTLRQQVPLGSSSASMYPRHSPADHEYGKAADEYGKVAAEARAKGIEIKHPDAECEVGQAKGVKRKSLAEIQEAQAAKGKTSVGGSGGGTGSGSDDSIKRKSKEPANTNGQTGTKRVKRASPEGDNPYFIIDTKPTPVNIPGMSSQHLKRSASPVEAVEGKKHKKAKNKHDGEMPKEEDTQEVKFQDISEQVDARMKEKEKKRKMKEEKKRKRESEGEHAAAAEESQPAAEPPAVTAEEETPKKKKKTKKTKKKVRGSEDEPLPDRSASKKRLGEGDGGAEDGEGKRKKKRKKNDDTANGQ